jgi:hypothetical protein
VDLRVLALLSYLPWTVLSHRTSLTEKSLTQFNPDKRTLLPGIAFNTFTGRFAKPSKDEGFDVEEIKFEVSPVSDPIHAQPCSPP